jgi:RHS repeat-associated protein
MQLASGSHIPDGLLAANALLSEKLHQGFAAPKSTLHQGFSVSISSTPLGIIGPLYDAGTGSRYTGKERDSETGNDYMFARYYNSATGRFLSPDWSAKYEPVPYAKLDDPQTLNLYSYVGNNPVGRADADGHFWHELWNAVTTGCGCWTPDHAQAVAINDKNEAYALQQMSQYHVTVQQDIVFPIGLEGLAAAGSSAAAASESGTVTRYMGPGEAQTATETGNIPNTNAQGEPRPTHVTTDPPLDSASEAAQKYELPTEPTHRATVPADRVPDLGPAPDGRPTTSGGGSQSATPSPIPVKPGEIKPLNQ